MYQLLSLRIKVLPGCDPDTSYLEQEGFENRLRQYKAGLFDYIGIRAEAIIFNSTSRLLQFISSGGLWGIESDSNRSDLEGTAKEELEELKSELQTLGITWSEEKAQEAIKKATF